MATAGEITDKAAQRMGLKGIGQTLSSELTTSLDASYVETYAQLKEKELTTWDFDEEVPDALVDDVVTLVAALRVNDHSVPLERYQRIVAMAPGAIPNMRVIQASNVYKTPVATYY